VRIETDANSTYHNANDPDASRLNFIATGEGLVVKGSTPLTGGRLRVILECMSGTPIGQQGGLRVELTRAGLPTLSDQRLVQVVEPPPARPTRRALTLPPFDVRAVAPQDEQWAILGWPDDAGSVASSAEMEDGVHVVYYSTAFPKYATQRARYEQREPAVAASFTKRYEVWLATHSLLLHHDQQSSAPAETLASAETNPDVAEEQERLERCRMATVAGLFAAREVDAGIAAAINESAADGGAD
jgi:hypothetical protein